MNLQLWSKWLFSVALILLVAQSVPAQKVANTGPKYDLANQVKVQGVVEEVREVPGQFEGTHLLVKTDKGPVLVQVAPPDFLQEIDTSFKKGDEVQVLGAKAPTATGTEEEVVAREITVGNNTTTLRDDKGVPVWAGWKPSKTGK